MCPTPWKYLKEQRDFVVRAVLDQLDDYLWLRAACTVFGPKIGIGLLIAATVGSAGAD